MSRQATVNIPVIEVVEVLNAAGVPISGLTGANFTHEIWYQGAVSAIVISTAESMRNQ